MRGGGKTVSRNDEISSPKHYKVFPGVDSIDVIEKALSKEEFVGFCKGNILKYRLRAGNKGPADQCIAKANWYRDVLLELEQCDVTAVVGPCGNEVDCEEFAAELQREVQRGLSHLDASDHAALEKVFSDGVSDDGGCNEIGKPSWDCAPEWARWLAQDADGAWRWLGGNSPSPGVCLWLCKEPHIIGALGEPNANWRDTLEPRP